MGIKTVCIDYGHCLNGADTGARSQYGKEEVLTRQIGTKVKELLQKNGVTVIETVTTQTFNSISESLKYRTDIENKSNVDLFVSIHLNCFNGKAYGTEIFTYGGKHFDEANRVLSNICSLGYYNRGIKDGSNLYVIKHTKAKSMLIECCFIDNKDDMTRFNVDKMALAIAEGILGKKVNVIDKVEKPIEIVKTTEVKVTETTNTDKTPITGKSILTKEQMKEYCLKGNPNPQLTCTLDELIDLFLSEGETENIRGDIAFCQSIKETGFFKYTGDVLYNQQNFSGIGALNSLKGQKGKGAWFDTPKQGVRAQIQHLKAYANKEPLVNGYIVDPRFNLVSRGIAPCWEDLNGRWAVPGNTYGQDILNIYNKIKAIKIEKPIEEVKEDTSKNEIVSKLDINAILKQLYAVECSLNDKIALIDSIKYDLTTDLQAIQGVKKYINENK